MKDIAKTTLVMTSAMIMALLMVPSIINDAQATDIREGLVGYYTFDETSGNLLDKSSDVEFSTPSGADFVNHNVVRDSNGLIGGAYSYNGVNAYSQVPVGVLDNPLTTGSFTYNTWIKSNVSDEHAEGQLFTRGYVSSGGVHGFYSGVGDGTITVGRHVGAGYDHVKCTGKTELMNPVGSWQMYSMTFDKETGLVSSYINGELCTSETKTTADISYNSRYDNGFTFAAHVRNVSNSYSSMTVDETSIFNTVKTASEISELYNNGNGLDLSTYGADTVPPVITLLGNSTVTTDLNSIYVDVGATARDDVDGDITDDIITNNPVDTAVVGNYAVTYDVSDSAGNNATQVTRTVNVVEPLDESEMTIYLIQGTQKTIPASSNSQFAIAYCNEGDIAISGSWNINGYVEGVNGIRITNSVPTSEDDTSGWYFRLNNISDKDAQFTPAVLCISNLR